MTVRSYLRDDDGGHFIGDDGLGLVVVNTDCREGVHAQRSPVVRHPVAMDTFEGRG